MTYTDITGEGGSYAYIGKGRYNDILYKIYVHKDMLNKQKNVYVPSRIRMADLCFIKDNDNTERCISNNVPRYILVDNSVKLSILEMDNYDYDNSYILNRRWKLLTGEAVTAALSSFPYVIWDTDDERAKNKFFYYMLPLNEDSAALLMNLKISYFVMYYNEIKKHVYVPMIYKKLSATHLKKITDASDSYKVLLELNGSY